jgi:hypothetical protein
MAKLYSILYIYINDHLLPNGTACNNKFAFDSK